MSVISGSGAGASVVSGSGSGAGASVVSGSGLRFGGFGLRFGLGLRFGGCRFGLGDGSGLIIVPARGCEQGKRQQHRENEC